MDPDTVRKQKKQPVRIKSGQTKKHVNVKYVVRITFFTFAMSGILSLASSTVLKELGFFLALLLLLIFIFLGILFDIIGMAAASADETPFHSMSARRVRAAHEAVWIIRNAEKVTNFCNDVVGDIVGVISGSTCAVIVSILTSDMSAVWQTVMGLTVTALTAATTVGGKAIGKTIAINNSNTIVYHIARLMAVFRRDDKNK